MPTRYAAPYAAAYSVCKRTDTRAPPRASAGSGNEDRAAIGVDRRPAPLIRESPAGHSVVSTSSTVGARAPAYSRRPR